MKTGIPKGLPILIPALGSAGPGPGRLGSPGVVPATRPMLRPGASGQHCCRRGRCGAPACVRRAPGRDAAVAGAEITATVGAVPYPPGMGDETTAAEPATAVPDAAGDAPAAEEAPRKRP